MEKFRTENCFCIKTHMKDGIKIKKGSLYTMTINIELYNHPIKTQKNYCIVIENAYEFKSGMFCRTLYKRNMFDKYFIWGSEIRKYKLEKINKL